MGVKEEPEVVKYVIEQVMDDNSSLDRIRQDIDELVVFLYLIETVVGPVVLEVLVDLLIERIGQGFVLSEPGQQGHPIVQVECLLLVA